MTSLVSLTYGGKTQTVALFEGLSPDELTSVLQTVFGFSGNVVGILGEVGAQMLLTCIREEIHRIFELFYGVFFFDKR